MLDSMFPAAVMVPDRRAWVRRWTGGTPGAMGCPRLRMHRKTPIWGRLSDCPAHSILSSMACTILHQL